MRRFPDRLLVVAALSVPVGVLASSQLRYDREYPAIGYSTATPTDPVARLARKVEAGETELNFDAASGRGYLESLLRALDIPVSSQILVFSKTSFQKGLISPTTPRAIYFADDVYVAWVQKGPVIEISALDPDLGAVFYTLPQKRGPPKFERQTFTCLQCHDSYSLTGGGVPRHIMGSGRPDETGRLLSHEGWILTDDQTATEQRWGGWYVTGTSGDMRHQGNAYGAPPRGAPDGASVTDLSQLFDAQPYLGRHSDIVALLVIEHQVHVQNLITRTAWDARSALSKNELPDVARLVEPLVRALLFANEAPLLEPVSGTSSFASDFVLPGPFDERGRSLRELDLKTRLFRYPCSYLVYSRAFDALPGLIKHEVYRQLREALAGESAFDHLQEADRKAVLEILEATKPDFAASFAE